MSKKSTNTKMPTTYIDHDFPITDASASCERSDDMNVPKLSSLPQSGKHMYLIIHKQLQVSPSSELAGITYHNADDRHICLYWQSESSEGEIYESTFLQGRLRWQLQSVSLVATGARRNTAIAAVTWANGARRALYFLNKWNLICERLCQNGNDWSDGTLGGYEIAVRDNSALAVADQPVEMGGKVLYLYYQDWDNYIRQLVHNKEEGWHEMEYDSGDKNPKRRKIESTFTALPCTSLAVVNCQIPKVASYQSIVSLDSNRCPQYWLYEPSEGFYSSKLFKMGRIFGQYSKFSCPPMHWTDAYFIRIYCGDGNKIIEKIWDKDKWRDDSILPNTANMETSTFVALGWEHGRDNLESVHLFSLVEDRVLDYIVGTSTKFSFSLTKDQYRTT